MSHIDLFSDGSCVPPRGGYAFVAVKDNAEVHRHAGAAADTTCNRMEMMALLEAIRWARTAGYSSANVYTDSLLTVNIANRVWRPKKNLDLVKAIAEAMDGMNIHVSWVKGHANGKHPWNERADALAGEASGRPAFDPNAMRKPSRFKRAARPRRKHARESKPSKRAAGLRRTGQADRPQSGWRAPGSFGPASEVRRIDPADYREPPTKGATV